MRGAGVERVEIGGGAEIGEQQEAVLEIVREHPRCVHAGGSEQRRDGDVRPAILVRRRRVHRDERGLAERRRLGDDAEIAAKARVRRCRRDRESAMPERAGDEVLERGEAVIGGGQGRVGHGAATAAIDATPITLVAPGESRRIGWVECVILASSAARPPDHHPMRFPSCRFVRAAVVIVAASGAAIAHADDTPPLELRTAPEIAPQAPGPTPPGAPVATDDAETAGRADEHGRPAAHRTRRTARAGHRRPERQRDLPACRPHRDVRPETCRRERQGRAAHARRDRARGPDLLRHRRPDDPGVRQRGRCARATTG